MLIADRTAPALFASSAGLLGGAERVLLDCATRLPRPAVVACPEGPLADAGRAAGLPRAGVSAGALRLRRPAAPRDPHDDVAGALSTTAALQAAYAAARHAAGLTRAAWDVGGLVHRPRPPARRAWGSRAVLATAVVPRRPPTVAVLHDIHEGAVRTAVRAAA